MWVSCARVGSDARYEWVQHVGTLATTFLRREGATWVEPPDSTHVANTV